MLVACKLPKMLSFSPLEHLDLFPFILQSANDKFVREKQAGQAATERETMLKELATAYDIYMELLGNLREGNKVRCAGGLGNNHRVGAPVQPKQTTLSFCLEIHRINNSGQPGSS